MQIESEGSQLQPAGSRGGQSEQSVAMVSGRGIVPDVLVVPFERVNPELLGTLIESAKSGDALAPVTVVVPSNFAGLQLRRALAANGGHGLLNVRFLVLARLAELLGAPLLASEGRQPLTPWLQYAALRSALRGHEGVLATIRDHPSTPGSLIATFRDLRNAPDGTVGELDGRGGVAAEVAGLYRRFRSLTERMYDAEDLAEAAARAVKNASGALRDIGTVIVYLPRTLTPGSVQLLEVLRAQHRAVVLLGASGERAVDQPTADLLVRLGVAEMEELLRRSPRPEPGSETRIAIGVDTEEEARIIVRLVAQEMGNDVSLPRIGVLHALPEHGSLLREQFRTAGIPCNGTAARTLAQSVSGRSLLGLFELAGSRNERFRRDAVMRWLTQAPILDPGEPNARRTPSAVWDAISRKAGVVRGADEWRRRISTWLARPRRSGGAAPWERTYGERLASFITGLEADVALLPTGAGARDHANHALRLMDRYMGDESAVAKWRDAADEGDAKDSELEAYRAIRRLLEEIGRTDGAGKGLDFLAMLPAADARRAFIDGLTVLMERPGASEGRFGEGVFIGPVSAASGMQFDLVFIAGMVEGAMPPANREDPLLPDDVRQDTHLDSRQSRRNEARRDFLAAMASAPRQVLSYARSGARQQGKQLPSRWLVEAAEQLSGQRFKGGDFERLRPAEHSWLIAPPSFESALSDTSLEPASAQEYELRSLLQAGGPPFEHYLATDASFGHALRVAAGRLPGWLVREPAPPGASAWDGQVAADTRLIPWIGTGDREPVTMSPTSLEAFADCPYRFFLRSVLRLEELRAPEEMLKLDATERGIIIHDTLERFFTQARPHEPGEIWNRQERVHLQAILNERFVETERAGLAGPQLMWEAEKARIRRELDRFLSADEVVRRETGARFRNAEKGFGRSATDDDSEPWPGARVELGDGRWLLLSGQVDRVDETSAGFAVYDYKSGSSFEYKEITRRNADPLVRGKKLQLPAYALAVRQAVAGAAEAGIEAKYWFVNEREGFKQIGYLFDEAHEQRFIEVLNVIAQSVTEGQFPQTPSEKTGIRGTTPANCSYCPFDRLCPASSRRERWEQTMVRPELARLAALINGADAESEVDTDE